MFVSASLAIRLFSVSSSSRDLLEVEPQLTRLLFAHLQVAGGELVAEEEGSALCFSVFSSTRISTTTVALGSPLLPRFDLFLLSYPFLSMWSSHSFATFAKIGSGMNIQDYDWISKWHGKHFKTFDRNRKSSWPSFIQFSTTGIEDKPDVWIHPRNSFICSVKASEVIPTADFAIGMTVSFQTKRSFSLSLPFEAAR